MQGRVYIASADRYPYVYDATGCGGQAFCAPLWRGQLDLFAFATAGCGRVTCEALRLVVPSREQNYSGAPLAVAGDRIAFVSNDNTDEHSNVAIMGLP
ncbi:MAG: hypothetical protein JSR59_10830 [Proteobacteria bacterium]|nr:hypothetical protein [Pseudomonadota bacterium]